MKKSQQTEILLAAVLGIILLGYFAVVYLITPMRARIADTDDQIFREETAILTAYSTVSAYPKQSEELKKLSDALNKSADRFYAKEAEENHLDAVNLNIRSCNISFTSMSALEGHLDLNALCANEGTGAKAYAALSEDEWLKKSAFRSRDAYTRYFDEMKASGGRLDAEIRTTTMTLEATGRYEDVLAFLNQLTTQGKNIICHSLTLDLAENISLTAPANPSARLVVKLSFVNVPGIPSLCGISEPEPLPKYTFPQDIVDGSYRHFRNPIPDILNRIRNII